MPRFSGGTEVPNSAVAIGMMPPPPMAWIARARSAISKLPTLWLSPHSSEPTPNSVMLSR